LVYFSPFWYYVTTTKIWQPWGAIMWRIADLGVCNSPETRWIG
jgi:hypothetical protein